MYVTIGHRLRRYRSLLLVALLLGPCCAGLWAQDAVFGHARARADGLISAFEQSLQGNGVSPRQAALELQRDPMAVAALNKNAADALKTRLNQEMAAIKDSAKSITQRHLADHYGVALDDVSFFEATNKSPKIKSGQDWDVTAKVKGIDVPLEVYKGALERGFYRAANGVDPPGATPAQAARAAADFAHQQAVEIINRQGREAYGYGKNEGGQIIDGSKASELRDPHQISRAIEVKSNIPAQRARALEAKPNPSLADLMDAQGQWLEQARQFTKQFDSQIAQRVKAMGANVARQVEAGTEILRRVAALDISPAEGRALLKAIGETPETIISKGAGLVEAAHVLRPPKAKGPAAADLIAENARDQLILEKLAKDAAERRAGTASAAEPKPVAREPGAGRPNAPSEPARPVTPGGKNARDPVAPSRLPGAVGGAIDVAGGTGLGFSVATLFLDYQACLDQGRNPKNCEAEFAVGAGLLSSFIAAGGLVVPVVIAGLEIFVSPVVITTGVAILTAYGLHEAGIALHDAADRWVNAPEVLAGAHSRHVQKGLLMEFARLTQVVQADIDGLKNLQTQSFGQCQRIDVAVQAAMDMNQRAQLLAQRLASLLPAGHVGQSPCDEARELSSAIQSLQRSAKTNEDAVIKGLDGAIALAKRCSAKLDANRVFEAYADAQALAERMLVDAAMARGRNKRLGSLQASLGGDGSRLQAAREIRDQLGSLNGQMRANVASAVASRDQINAANAQFVAKRSQVQQRIAQLMGHLPDRAPSPIYEPELHDAKARMATLTEQWTALPDSILCAYGAYNPASLVTLQQQSDKRLGEASTGVSALAQAREACAGLATQDAVVDAMDASANWASAAVRINEPLLQQADACLQGTARGATQCPANSALAWSAGQQVSQCQCKPGYQSADNGASCVAAKPPPPPLNMACNTTSKAGSNPPQTIHVSVGRNAGTAQLSYDMFVEPDQMVVQYGDKVLADTGCTSGRKTIALALDGGSEQVTISVKPSCRNKNAATNWNFSLGCPAPGGGQAAGATPGGAHDVLPHRLLLVGASGDASVFLHSPLQRVPLRQSSDIGNGSTLHLGGGAQAVLKSPTETQVTVRENSQVRVVGTENGRQTVELLRGSVDVNRRQGLPGSDDIMIRSEEGSIVAKGTRYRAQRTERGTEVEVFEGTVHLSGEAIIRIYGPGVDAGKPSPVQELDLTAGQKALLMNTSFKPSASVVVRPNTPPSEAPTGPLPPGARERTGGPSGATSGTATSSATGNATSNASANPSTSPSTSPSANPTSSVPSWLVPSESSPLARADPWNSPQVQQLMDAWLGRATPVVKPGLPGPWRFTEWGQAVGPGTKVGGAPEHPAGWSRYQSLWAKRMQFDSMNLCTLGEFIERNLAGKRVDNCQQATPTPTPMLTAAPAPAPPPPSAIPSWLSPSVAVAKPGAASTDPAAAIAAARSEVAAIHLAKPREAAPAPTPSPMALAVPPAALPAPRVASPVSATDFSGDWDCTISVGPGRTSSVSPSIARAGNGYRIETMTSGMQGLVFASSITVDGNQITIVHQHGAGVMTMVLTRNQHIISGTYHERWNTGENVRYPLACSLAGAAGAPARLTPTPRTNAREDSRSKK